MDKNKSWIISFQYASGETIGCAIACAEAKEIREAMEIADAKIRKFVRSEEGEEGEEVKVFITFIGIVMKEAIEQGIEFYIDPTTDPDPELFK